MLMPKRKWKDIVGYEGLYQVSNLGEIKSFHKNKSKILRGRSTSRGYLSVSLCSPTKKERKFIHRLVAMHFIDNPKELPCVNHKDENPSNNMASNLEWCTHKYNMNYGTVKERIGASSKGRKRSKKSIDQQIERQQRKVHCIELDVTFNSLRDAAEYVGVNSSGITKAAKGEQKTSGGYHWKYLEKNPNNRYKG